MKIAWKIFAVAVVSLGVQAQVWAGVSCETSPGNSCQTAAVTITATVDQQATLDCTVVQFRNVGGTEVSDGEVPAMTFGNLDRRFEIGDEDGDGIPNEPLALIGDKFFKTFCGVNATGKGYNLVQTANNFAGPGPDVDKAFVFVPIQATTDGSGDASKKFGVMGPCDLATGGGSKLWLASTGQAGVAEAVYSITDVSPHLSPTAPASCSSEPSGFSVISPGAPAGAYSTSVTWTLSVNP